jgi:hypothetical protein
MRAVRRPHRPVWVLGWRVIHDLFRARRPRRVDIESSGKLRKGFQAVAAKTALPLTTIKAPAATALIVVRVTPPSNAKALAALPQLECGQLGDAGSTPAAFRAGRQPERGSGPDPDRADRKPHRLRYRASARPARIG